MSDIALKIICPNKVPPSGYRFKYPWKGEIRWSSTENNSLNAAYHEAAQFYKANDLGDPPTLRQIEQDMCELLGPEWCMQFTPEQPIFYPATFNASAVFQGGKTLLHHLGRAIAQGTRKLVPDEEVKRRASICATGEGGARCRYNRTAEQIGECASCSGGTVKAAVESLSKTLTGCIPTPHDSQLGACSICACPLRSKICVDTDIILNNMPKTQQLKLPAWCWLKS